MGYKDRFYSELRADFEKKQEKSFLFRYMKKEKEKKPGSAGRKDSYAQLEECFSKLKKGKTDERAYLIMFLGTLSESAKLQAEFRSKDLLLDYGKKIGGKAFFEDARSNEKKYKKLLHVLKTGTEALPEADHLEKLHEELLNSILKVDAKTFLYDVGHPYKQENNSGRGSRKKDRSMDMLDAYCEENHIFFGQQRFGGRQRSGKLSEREEKFYENLYTFLNAEGRDDIIIPIQIDSLTGAGLYIMGSDYFPEAVWKRRNRARKKEECCCYACFYWSDLGRDDEDRGLEFRWLSSEDYDWNECCSYPGISEAWDWYHEYMIKFAWNFFEDFGEEIWEAYRSGLEEHDWEVFQKSFLTVSEEELREVQEEEERRFQNRKSGE